MALTILKLGGSIISHKYTDGDFAAEAVARLAQEIKQALTAKPQQLILIHGGGGKVHRLARQFGLKEGAKTAEQIRESLLTHYAVRELTQQVLGVLTEADLPIMPLPTSSIFTVKQGQPILLATDIIQQTLDKGLIPMLSGDMVLDDRVNFSILSGDRIATVLAKQLGADRIIFASDVDGLYSDDPKVNQYAKLIERIDIAKLKAFDLPTGQGDTSGQMLGKVASLIHDDNQTPVTIINGLAPGRLQQALIGQLVPSTLITAQ